LTFFKNKYILTQVNALARGIFVDYQEKIKEWKPRIKKSSVSQREFAEMVGVSVVAVHYWITGSRTPSLYNFEKVENALRRLGV
jgi:hypothetical protein